jgi:hypothetical protein
MNKNLIIIVAFVLVVIGGAIFFISSRKKEKPAAEKKTSLIETEQFNTLAVKDRPYLSLWPSTGGGEVFLSIDQSDDQNLDYEIEYQATNAEGGTLIQGGGGQLDLTSLKQPTSPKEFCFCSESKGKKKYDTGVSGGSVVLRFSGGSKGDYNLKGDFTIGSKEDRNGVFTSRDVIAKLTLGDKDLDDSTVVLVADTFGLPVSVDGEIIEGPYGFFVSQGTSSALKDSQLTFQTNKDINGAKLLAYDQTAKKWLELINPTIEGSKISVAAPFLSTYILVK